MKLSELRPCASCGGAVLPQFYLVQTSLAILGKEGHRNLGMVQFMGGIESLFVAEALVPNAEDSVVVAGEKEPSLMTKIFLCAECYLNKEHNLAVLAETSYRNVGPIESEK